VRFLRSFLVLVLGLILVPATAAPAFAICMLSASPLNFGQYSEIARDWIMSVGTISYTCTGPLPAGIRIAIGPGHSGEPVRREMIAGGAKLYYLLSLDPRGSVPWGDGTDGSTMYYDAHPPRNRTVTVQVYGRIPPGERVPANRVFSDSVSVVAYY